MDLLLKKKKNGKKNKKNIKMLKWLSNKSKDLFKKMSKLHSYKLKAENKFKFLLR